MDPVDPAVGVVVMGILYLLGGILYFEWRSRNLVRTFAPRALQALQDAVLVQEDVVTEAGEKRVLVKLQPRAEVLLRAVLTSTVRTGLEVLKTVKVGKTGGAASPLAGLDLAHLDVDQMLAAGIQLVPRKYQGYVAIAAPFLKQVAAVVLGGLGGSKPAAGSKTSEIPKELQ